MIRHGDLVSEGGERIWLIVSQHYCDIPNIEVEEETLVSKIEDSGA